MSTLIDYPPEIGPRLDPPVIEEPPAGHALRNFLLFCTAFLLIFCVVCSTVTIVLIRQSQDDSHKTLDTITDCTSSSGTCYKENQEGQRKAIALIAGNTRAAAAAAAACATSLQQQNKLPVDYTKAYRAILKCQTATLSTGSPSQSR